MQASSFEDTVINEVEFIETEISTTIPMVTVSLINNFSQGIKITLIVLKEFKISFNTFKKVGMN